MQNQLIAFVRRETSIPKNLDPGTNPGLISFVGKKRFALCRRNHSRR